MRFSSSLWIGNDDIVLIHVCKDPKSIPKQIGKQRKRLAVAGWFCSSLACFYSPLPVPFLQNLVSKFSIISIFNSIISIFIPVLNLVHFQVPVPGKFTTIAVPV